MSAYEYRDKMLNIDALTVRDAQFIIQQVRKIPTRSRVDLRPQLRAAMRSILEAVANGHGDPFTAYQDTVPPSRRPTTDDQRPAFQVACRRRGRRSHRD